MFFFQNRYYDMFIMFDQDGEGSIGKQEFGAMMYSFHQTIVKNYFFLRYFVTIRYFANDFFIFLLKKIFLKENARCEFIIRGIEQARCWGGHWRYDNNFQNQI